MNFLEKKSIFAVSSNQLTDITFMTTYTITIDEKTKSGKSLIAYLRSLGIVQEPEETTLKAVKELKEDNKLVAAERLEQRTNYDIEMLEETGFCSGIENYSRYFDGRNPGSRPFCLLDYFPDNFLTIIDESHVTVPQIRAMYGGDLSRKMNLVEYGFRLPAALDNRPLKFEEFESLTKQIIYVSATPGDYELELVNNNTVEQIIRPTGLLDPEIEVLPQEGQIDHLISEINVRVEKGERVLVTTLTKRMAEHLTDFLEEHGIKVRYLHSDIDTIERMEIIRDLRTGEFDVLIGINLLREGIDIPEVSLIAIMDADKQGFLRSERSLIQTIGRAARNSEGRVIMYADTITGSMRGAIDETNRRREIQMRYNEENGITPQTIVKDVHEIIEISAKGNEEKSISKMSRKEREEMIVRLTAEMKAAAKILEFEHAAYLRDKIEKLRKGK